jgi:hypothetical protein
MKTLFVIGWLVSVATILMFMRGATYKGNIAEDPNYYGKEREK